MSNYKLFETDEFIKNLGKLNSRDKSLIEKKLSAHIYSQLKEEPHYGQNIKKLVDFKPETWRYRAGNYRIFYSIDEKEKVIFLLTIDLRKDSY